MHLRTLRAFVEVVQQGGFSQAARVVCTTQSSVSKSVKSLEERFGLPLFDRNRQRCHLTSAGEIVYRRAQAMLAERDALLEELRALPDVNRGVLRLGLPIAGGAIRFAALYAGYCKRYPGVEITLVEEGCQRLEDMLVAGELDIAAIRGPILPTLAAQDAGTEPLVAVMAAHHPLAGQESVKLAAVAPYPVILYEAGMSLNPLILDAFQSRGIVPIIAANSGQIDFIVQLVAADVGIAFLPAALAKMYLRTGIAQARVEADELDLQMVLAWRRGHTLSVAARAWLELAREMDGASA